MIQTHTDIHVTSSSSSFYHYVPKERAIPILESFYIGIIQLGRQPTTSLSKADTKLTGPLWHVWQSLTFLFQPVHQSFLPFLHLVFPVLLFLPFLPFPPLSDYPLLFPHFLLSPHPLLLHLQMMMWKRKRRRRRRRRMKLLLLADPHHH